jgi:hypothetical protein
MKATLIAVNWGLSQDPSTPHQQEALVLRSG